MENITLGQISVAIGIISAIGIFLWKATNPILQLQFRIKKIEEHQDKDLQRLDRQDKDLQQVLLSVNVLLSHSIDNNHTDQLKERKNELDDYLIKRSTV